MTVKTMTETTVRTVRTRRTVEIMKCTFHAVWCAASPVVAPFFFFTVDIMKNTSDSVK